VKKQNDTPSRIHNLLKLTAEALIDNLKEEVRILFTELNHYYSNTRYPDDFVEMEEEVSEPKTKKILDDTKGVFKWLEKKLN
jgi:HEPN domain-containing protein